MVMTMQSYTVRLMLLIDLYMRALKLFTYTHWQLQAPGTHGPEKAPPNTSVSVHHHTSRAWPE